MDHGDDIRIGFDEEVFTIKEGSQFDIGIPVPMDEHVRRRQTKGDFLNLDAIDIVLFDAFSLDFFSESVIFAPSQSANAFPLPAREKIRVHL